MASLAVHPDWVRTEGVLQFAEQVDLSTSQSPEGVGRAIVALASDPEVFGLTGQALTVGPGARYGVDVSFSVEGRGPDVHEGVDQALLVVERRDAGGGQIVHPFPEPGQRAGQAGDVLAGQPLRQRAGRR